MSAFPTGIVYLGELVAAGAVSDTDATFWCDASSGCGVGTPLKRVTALQLANYIAAKPGAGGGGTPGGSDTHAQYNNTGRFGGSSGLTLNPTQITGMAMALGGDATGDLYYRNAAGRMARLPIGSAGNILEVVGGIPAWATVGVAGGTVGSGAGPQIAQYPAGASSTSVAGVTVSGDATIGQGGALTLATVAAAGTFQGITFNAKGLVTGGVNQNYAPLASPNFSGLPTAPTPATADNSTTLATTAFVATSLATRPLSTAAPTNGYVLGWNGSTWLPVAAAVGGGITSITFNAPLTGGTITTTGTVGLAASGITAGVYQGINFGVDGRATNAIAMSGDATMAVQVLTINANAVTYGKMQAASAAARLIGSAAAATALGEIILGTNLSMTGSTLNGAATPPGGAVNTVQYNNAGAFGGAAALTVNAAGTAVTGLNVAPGADATGDIYFRSATPAFTRLAIGASGLVLGSTGTLPAWQGISTPLDSLGAAQGSILYRSAAGWVALGPGTSGYLLQTLGPGANPSWVSVATGAGTVSNAIIGQMAQYTGTSVVGGVTITGDATIAAGGALTLANTAINPGGVFAYPASLTVDAKGRITAATVGLAPLPLTGGTLTGSLAINLNPGANSPPPLLANQALGIYAADGASANQRMYTWGVGGAALLGYGASGTNAAPTLPASGTNLVTLGALGLTTAPSTYSGQQASINLSTAEAWTAGHYGTQIAFSTTQIGQSTNTVRAMLQQGLLINASTGTAPTGGDQGPGTINTAGDHYVNGVSARQRGATVSWLAGANPNGGILLVADRALTITLITAIPEVLAGAVATASLYKAPSGTLLASGTAITTIGAMNFNTGAGTAQNPGISVPSLAAGDRLGVVVVAGGTWTASVGSISVTVV